MTDMIERVAMAMYSSTGLEFGLQEEWKDRHDKAKDEWRHLARAAIAAMREPTETMIDAGSKEQRNILSKPIEGIWAAIIDAALGDE